MDRNQKGFGLIILIIGLAIIALMAAWYFTRTGNNPKSQFETGQAAIEQAKEINQKSSTEAQQLQQQIDAQSDANIY